MCRHADKQTNNKLKNKIQHRNTWNKKAETDVGVV